MACSQDGSYDGWLYVDAEERELSSMPSLTLNTAVGLIIGFIFGARDLFSTLA